MAVKGRWPIGQIWLYFNFFFCRQWVYYTMDKQLDRTNVAGFSNKQRLLFLVRLSSVHYLRWVIFFQNTWFSWRVIYYARRVICNPIIELNLLGLVIALRPQTPKHVRGRWSHYADTSKPVDGYGAQNIITGFEPATFRPLAQLTTCTCRAHKSFNFESLFEGWLLVDSQHRTEQTCLLLCSWE
jgi:hypothetical protein